jgi:hypothetical protein
MVPDAPRFQRRHRTMRRTLLLLVALTILSRPAIPQASRDDFVHRDGSHLTLHGQLFRFAGANIYWLGLDENVDGVRYPTKFRTDDALQTAKEMGATVVRAHTLGISTGNSLSIEPARNQFNDRAFVPIDYAIAEAARLGIRLIIPLTDNYHYYSGGKHNFTDWEHLPENEFFTNASVIGDFETYIQHLLNHVSPITGIALKDDPTILAWETGNEIYPPTTWTATIAGYLKSIDKNHLVVDGHYGVDEAALSLADIDLCSAHFNGTVFKMTAEALNRQVIRAAGKRPLLVGEFDWSNRHGSGNLIEFLSATRNATSVAGATYWSLFGHNDRSGYVQHLDGFTLHYPGDTLEMRSEVSQLRTFAFEIRGLNVPPYGIPEVPEITGIARAGFIAWRGAANASTYQVERSLIGPSGPWVVLTTGSVTDNDTPWKLPSGAGHSAWYRVKGANLSGQFGPYSLVYVSDSH